MGCLGREQVCHPWKYLISGQVISVKNILKEILPLEGNVR